MACWLPVVVFTDRSLKVIHNERMMAATAAFPNCKEKEKSYCDVFKTTIIMVY